MTAAVKHDPTSVGRQLGVWGAALVFSMALWRHTLLFYNDDFIKSVQAAQGVLTGYPHWRNYQSRLLGPWAVQSLTVLGINFTIAHILVGVAALTATGIVLFHAGRAAGGRQAGWSAMMAFYALFLMTMTRPWLYIWDYFIVLTWAVFLLLVIRRAPWWAFLLLMAVSFFNHEIAALIGVWMAVQALADGWAGRRRPDWRMLGGGILGVLGGAVTVEYLRTVLLKREIGWEIFSDVGKGPSSPLDAYFHVQIFANIKDIAQWFANPDWYFTFLIPVMLIVALAFGVIIAIRHGLRAAGLLVYVVGQITALMALGLLAETRTLLQLAPFLSIGGILAAKADWNAAPPVR
jgi:hypothetical protein